LEISQSDARRATPRDASASCSAKRSATPQASLLLSLGGDALLALLPASLWWIEPEPVTAAVPPAAFLTPFAAATRPRRPRCVESARWYWARAAKATAAALTQGEQFDIQAQLLLDQRRFSVAGLFLVGVDRAPATGQRWPVCWHGLEEPPCSCWGPGF
jgi:hypothetical protein